MKWNLFHIVNLIHVPLNYFLLLIRSYFLKMYFMNLVEQNICLRLTMCVEKASLFQISLLKNMVYSLGLSSRIPSESILVSVSRG